MVENEQPPLGFKRRQSRGLAGLVQAEPVTKSPFRASSVDTHGSEKDVDDAGFDTEGDLDGDSGNDDEPLAPPPSKAILVPSPSSRSASPTRSSLVSKRLHGPRIFGGEVGGKRQRRKTVTFDEQCDVLEFDRDESSMEVDEDPFDIDDDDDHDDYGDPEPDALNGGSHRQPSAHRRSDQHSHQHHHHGQPHEHDEEEEERDDREPSGRYPPADDSITGLMDSMLQGAGSNERASARTPEHDELHGAVVLPPDAETEDGVPYGRSHHAERATATHSRPESPLTPTTANTSGTPSRPDSPRTPTIHSSNGKIHSGRRDARRNSGELGELTEQESEGEEEGPSREGQEGEEEGVPRFELENLLRDAPKFEGTHSALLERTNY